MTKQIRNTLLLFLTSLIWGVAFVAQSEGGNLIGAFTFNGVRSFIGAIALSVVILIKKNNKSENKRELWTGGCLCGVALFLASSCQQIGINMGAEAGKAGFITANYIILVPILGLFLKKKCGWNIWLGVVLATAGLFLLCLGDSTSLTIEKSDIFLILCALLFSIQILLVDHYSPKVDGVKLSCIQLLVTGVLSMPMILFKELPAAGITVWAQGFQNSGAWISLLYAGVMSCGIAYTLQIIAQDGLNPTFASMIMSLESVFAAIAGAVILHEFLSGKEIMGCILTFVAIIISQFELGGRG